jgi:hypothetical protein
LIQKIRFTFSMWERPKYIGAGKVIPQSEVTHLGV